VVAPNDLHSNRSGDDWLKAPGTDIAGFPCRRAVTGGPHPGNVVLHLHASNLGRVVSIHIERKHLIDRQNEKFRSN